MKLKKTVIDAIHTSVGRGVFSIVEIQAGEKVIESRPVETLPYRNKYSLEPKGNHIIIDEPGVLVNHSCDPNCVLVPNDYDAFDFMACRHIPKGEEITYDYMSIECEIVGFRDCYCGAENCRKVMNAIGTTS